MSDLHERINDPQWQKQRKAEWKLVKEALDKHFPFWRNKAEQVKLKNYFLTGDATFIKGEDGLMDGFVLAQLWLHPDTSQERWDDLWHKLTDAYDHNDELFGFSSDREKFFRAACSSSDYGPQGAFNGMEERLVKFFIRADRYTQEKIKMERSEAGLLPTANYEAWPTPEKAYLSFIWNTVDLLARPESNVYNPYQYQPIIDIWFSCFDYEFDLAISRKLPRRPSAVENFVAAIAQKSLLQDGEDHPNRICFARTVRKLLDERPIPDPIKDLWEKAKTEQGIAP
jgi:hypothetical protein